MNLDTENRVILNVGGIRHETYKVRSVLRTLLMCSKMCKEFLLRKVFLYLFNLNMFLVGKKFFFFIFFSSEKLVKVSCEFIFRKTFSFS